MNRLLDPAPWMSTPIPLSSAHLEALVRASLSAVELERLAQRARALTRQRFGDVMQLYAPLYLSNACVNTCTYCGYSRSNDMPRRTLTVSEVQQEGRALAAQGIRHVLLVAGEHPKEVGREYLVQAVQALHGLFAAISIEVAPLEVSDYRQLCDAGVSGLVVYQETYNRDAYAGTHLAGPKKDFSARLQAPLKGAAAGMRLLGLGCLLGLAPWQDDFLALIHHAREVQKKAWSAQISLSFPRLQEAAGVANPVHPVSDRDLVKMILLARLSLPEAQLVLSTRERAEFRDAVAPLGITTMSAGSRTYPGAYSLGAETLEQFSLHDTRSVAEVRAALQAAGFDATAKDWDRELHGVPA